jgi:Cys-rich repeat protein
VSDCAAGLSCSSFFFVANADTRDVCEPGCTSDAQCGAGYVCTTYLQQNFCVQQCTADAQCPTSVDSQPTSGQPWYRLTCDVATGRCQP